MKRNDLIGEASAKSGNKTKRLLIAAAAAAAAIVIAVAVVIIVNTNIKHTAADKSTADAAPTEEATKQPEFVKMVEDKDTYLIDLGFVKLRYPAALKDTVDITGAEKHASSDKFTLTFSAEGTDLFALYFNEEKDNLLGTLPLEENPVVIYVKTFPLTSDDLTMREKQESLNVIIQGLIADYGFLTGEIQKEDDDNTVYEIKTDKVSLFYPAKWKDRITVTEKDKTLSFMDGEDNLFDLRFEECDGYLLGTYDGTPVYIVEYKAKNDDQIAMQQDVNVIINNLKSDEKFKMNI